MVATVRRALVVSFLLAAAALVPGVALAQTPMPRPMTPPADRGRIYVNGAYQAASNDVTSSVAFTANVESGSFTSKAHVKSGAALDLGGSVRVWRRLGVGAAFTSFSSNRTANVDALVPHPFFFNQPRSVSGTATLDHKETAFHVRAVVTSLPGRRLQFAGFAGPVFFSLRQGVVDQVNYSDAYPFDTATFTSATTRQVSKSKVGFGAGADVAYFFSKQVGVGLSASIAKATFSLKAVDDSTISVSAGGAIIGIGLRVRF